MEHGLPVLDPILRRCVKFTNVPINESVTIDHVTALFGQTEGNLEWFRSCFTSLGPWTMPAEDGVYRLVGFTYCFDDETESATSGETSSTTSLDDIPSEPPLTADDREERILSLEQLLAEARSLNEVLMSALKDGLCPMCQDHSRLTEEHVNSDEHKKRVARVAP